MSIRLILAAFALLAAPATAHACMASGPDGYVTGLVWDNKPSQVPEGAYVVRIDDLQPVENSWVFTARVLEGPEGMTDQRYRFMGRNLSSCVGLGSLRGYAVVAAEKADVPIDGEMLQVLLLIDYAPTTFNEVMRTLFGGSQWRFPGEPAATQELPF